MFLYGIDVNLFMQKKWYYLFKHILKRHFQEKNIFENSKLFPAPSLQPVDLKVILMEKT